MICQKKREEQPDPIWAEAHFSPSLVRERHLAAQQRPVFDLPLADAWGPLVIPSQPYLLQPLERDFFGEEFVLIRTRIRAVFCKGSPRCPYINPSPGRVSLPPKTLKF